MQHAHLYSTINSSVMFYRYKYSYILRNNSADIAPASRTVILYEILAPIQDVAAIQL